MKVFEALCLKLHWRLYLLVCYNNTIDCVLHNPHYTLCVGRKFMSHGYKNPQKKHEFLKPPSRGSGDQTAGSFLSHSPFLAVLFSWGLQPEPTDSRHATHRINCFSYTNYCGGSTPHTIQQGEGRFACFANFFDNYSYRQCAN